MNKIEKYLPISISIVIAFVVWKFGFFSYEMIKPLIKEFTSIGACVFGFVLTMFSLIIQSNSEAINKMRKRVIPFNRFVIFNKYVVIYSFFFTIFCYVAGFGHFGSLFGSYVKCLQNIVMGIFIGGFLHYIWLVLYFLLVFYILIIEKNDTVK